MLLGIDYPYWATFNLRAVFPQLQDALNVFPIATVYNQIVMDWPALRPSAFRVPFSLPDLQRQIPTLYGAYLVALSKGAKPYELHPRNRPPFALASFLVNQTGIDRETVVAFLATLEKLAKAGKIDLKYYAPAKAVELNKATAKARADVARSEPKGPIGEAADQVASAAKWIGGGALVALALGTIVLFKIK